MTGPAPRPRPHVLSVSQLVLRASNALAAELGTLAVEGEVSSFHHHGSGHMYWTLKDGTSEVRCVMFRKDAERIRVRLGDGARIVVTARPTIYRARGQFQLEVSDVEPLGHGELWRRYEELRARLAAEGLFDEARKRPLPAWPAVVGLVTSPEGAAVHDICTVIRRRAPATRVLLKAVPVQGRDAAPEIARAIRWFSERGIVEVVIVGRGGGSIEDLWAFNEEIVVRAIVASRVPVVSAVGHESDTTLADHAADRRAPTPSAAAELVVPETRVIARDVVRCFRRLAAAIERRRLGTLRSTEATIRRYGFLKVRDRLNEDRQRFWEATDALPRAAGRRRAEAERALGSLRRLGHRRLADRLGWDRRRWATGTDAAARAVRRRKDREAGRAEALVRRLPREVAIAHGHARARAESLEQRLRALDPEQVVKRGYAVVRGPDGRVLVDAAAVAPGAAIAVRLGRGGLAAHVTEVHPHPQEEAPR